MDENINIIDKSKIFPDGIIDHTAHLESGKSNNNTSDIYDEDSDFIQKLTDTAIQCLNLDYADFNKLPTSSYQTSPPIGKSVNPATNSSFNFNDQDVSTFHTDSGFSSWTASSDSKVKDTTSKLQHTVDGDLIKINLKNSVLCDQDLNEELSDTMFIRSLGDMSLHIDDSLSVAVQPQTLNVSSPRWLFQTQRCVACSSDVSNRNSFQPVSHDCVYDLADNDSFQIYDETNACCCQPSTSSRNVCYPVPKKVSSSIECNDHKLHQHTAHAGVASPSHSWKTPDQSPVRISSSQYCSRPESTPLSESSELCCAINAKRINDNSSTSIASTSTVDKDLTVKPGDTQMSSTTATVRKRIRLSSHPLNSIRSMNRNSCFYELCKRGDYHQYQAYLGTDRSSCRRWSLCGNRLSKQGCTAFNNSWTQEPGQTMIAARQSPHAHPVPTALSMTPVHTNGSPRFVPAHPTHVLESIPSQTDASVFDSRPPAPMPDVVPQTNGRSHFGSSAAHSPYHAQNYYYHYHQRKLNSPWSHHDNFSVRYANCCSPYSQMDYSLRIPAPRCSSVPLSITDHGYVTPLSGSNFEDGLDCNGVRLVRQGRLKMTNNSHLTLLARNMAHIGDELELHHSWHDSLPSENFLKTLNRSSRSTTRSLLNFSSSLVSLVTTPLDCVQRILQFASHSMSNKTSNNSQHNLHSAPPRTSNRLRTLSHQMQPTGIINQLEHRSECRYCTSAVRCCTPNRSSCIVDSASTSPFYLDRHSDDNQNDEIDCVNSRTSPIRCLRVQPHPTNNAPHHGLSKPISTSTPSFGQSSSAFVRTHNPSDFVADDELNDSDSDNEDDAFALHENIFIFDNN